MTVADRNVDQLLAQSAQELFARHSTADVRRTVPSGGWAQDLWSVAASAELPLLGVPEERGGSGGDLVHWAAVLRIAARHAAPIPLLETSTAGWLLAQAGLDVPAHPLTIASVTVDDHQRATASVVPYARQAQTIVVLRTIDDVAHVGRVTPADCELEPGVNIAGEPRDAVRFPVGALDDPRPVPASVCSQLRLRRALGRAIQIAGALEGAQDVTLAHVRDRVQFGVTLSRLPVVRDRLAILAEEVVAAVAAADVGVDGLSTGDGVLAVAAAKVRAGEAAGRGARVAHQLNGALGMTQEHTLHHFTRRLWAWRDEDGDDREWATELGRMLARAGGDRLWPVLAADARARTGA